MSLIRRQLKLNDANHMVKVVLAEYQNRESELKFCDFCIELIYKQILQSKGYNGILKLEKHYTDSANIRQTKSKTKEAEETEEVLANSIGIQSERVIPDFTDPEI